MIGWKNQALPPGRRRHSRLLERDAGLKYLRLWLRRTLPVTFYLHHRAETRSVPFLLSRVSNCTRLTYLFLPG